MTMAALVLAETLGLVRAHRAPGRTPPSPSARARHLSWLAENLAALHGLRLSVEGDVPEYPAVIVANHISYMDPVAVTSLVPCCAIAKSEIGDWPILGETGRELGVLLFERGSAPSGARVLLRAKASLEAGVSVLTFPEGTTTNGFDVLPFRRGIFGLARITNVPVVPVALSYDDPDMAWIDDQLFLPHYLRTTTRRSTRVRIAFGDPIDPQSADSPETLAAVAREEMRRLLRGPGIGR
jgi:1-acyl-sn-glycerol-3-phosphate acyltransferase